VHDTESPKIKYVLVYPVRQVHVFVAVFNPEELVVLQLGSHRHEVPLTTMF